jgi:hypothetical protein
MTQGAYSSKRHSRIPSCGVDEHAVAGRDQPWSSGEVSGQPALGLEQARPLG